MMAEFASLEDWGLQAIVRGSTGSCCNTTSSAISNTDPSSCFGLLDIPKDDDHDLFCSFPGLFETAAILTDELQELYKPFYTVSHSSTAAGPTTPSNSVSVCKEKKEEPEEVQEKLTRMDQPPAASIAAASTYMPKYKRRKNQHKRVVLQVTAMDLSSDMWAWRKYGQKPIKGSPYPRSYYRCSSSKGCLARKQVEQSCTDPSVFIITYTAEHNHSQPTRKNALAGTVRKKFSTSTRSNSKAAKKGGDSGRYSPRTSSALSPETPLLAEEEEIWGRNIERENKDANDWYMVDVSRNNGIFFPEVMYDDDFSSGLGDLDGFLLEFGDGQCSTEAVTSEPDLL